MGRAPTEEGAVRAALERGRRLLGHLARCAPEVDWQPPTAVLRQAEARLDQSGRVTADECAALYRQIRWATRATALKHPRLRDTPLAFQARKRFVCQMLHEYLGYYYDYGDIAGGGVCVLPQPGHAFETRDLIQGRLPPGNYTTLASSFDGRTLYFGFAPRAPSKPDFYSPERRCFHIYAVDADGSNLRQLTEGPYDDFDPCPLPDGGIAFMSTRRGGFGRCHNAWEPLPSYTLHRMNADGSELQTLSWHETNEWHPWVLNDGRIIYTRWDYVDRSAANYHGLWVTQPDGSNPMSLFGNYTTRINACYQPRAIPGSQRILFVAGAHHADVGGSLVLLDPRRAALDAASGEDSFESIEVLTPEVCFAEAAGWPKSYFHSPWPLSEDCYLVSFGFDPLPGMSSGEKRDTHTGLYYFDRWGNLELLYRHPDASAMYPIPLRPRARPPILASTRLPELGDEGEFLVQDVRRSLMPQPVARRLVDLRIYQVLPKTPPHVANQPRIGYANAESARSLLGTVPIEADGSAYFRVPARKPLYFQAVDDTGRAVQSMRSITYLQPGERRTCIGCHEPPQTAVPPTMSLASQRPASRISEGPDGSQPLSFPRLIQPVLDRHCVRCHDGQAGPGKSALALTGERTKTFTRAYDNLRPFVRWHEWGDASISQTATRPGYCGADASPLTGILDDSNHASSGFPPADRHRIYLWLDANAPFYGTYAAEQQLAQGQGMAVALPEVQ